MSFSDFQLSYEISPIILTGGSASGVPGGMNPIISMLQPDAFSDGGISSDGSDLPLDQYFAKFVPLPGSTLIENAVGEYPFANQAVAANAIITQPLKLSMLMICPVKDGGYSQKLSIMTALRSSLADHINQGGTFSVATPAFLYTNLLLLRLTDVTDGQTKQVQMQYQWDFYKPLLTQEDAEAAENNLMSKISGGTPVEGDPPTWSGTPPTVGEPPSLAAPSVIPAASNLSGAGAAGSSPRRSAGTDRFAP